MPHDPEKWYFSWKIYTEKNRLMKQGDTTGGSLKELQSERRKLLTQVPEGGRLEASTAYGPRGENGYRKEYFLK